MMNQFSRQRSASGFTLIEVLVVVIMIGILFSIVAPSWLGLINRQRASSSRDQVVQAIRLAQAEATRTRRDYSVIIDNSTNPVTLVVRPTTQTTGGIRQQIGEGRLTPTMIGIQATNGANATITRIDYDATGNLETTMNLPITIAAVSPAANGAKRCVIVETILGATRSVSRGEDPRCN